MKRLIFISLILLGILSEIILLNDWFIIPEYTPKIIYSCATFYFFITAAIYIETNFCKHGNYPKYRRE